MTDGTVFSVGGQMYRLETTAETPPVVTASRKVKVFNIGKNKYTYLLQDTVRRADQEAETRKKRDDSLRASKERGDVSRTLLRVGAALARQGDDRAKPALGVAAANCDLPEKRAEEYIFDEWKKLDWDRVKKEVCFGPNEYVKEYIDDFRRAVFDAEGKWRLRTPDPTLENFGQLVHIGANSLKTVCDLIVHMQSAREAFSNLPHHAKLLCDELAVGMRLFLLCRSRDVGPVAGFGERVLEKNFHRLQQG